MPFAWPGFSDWFFPRTADFAGRWQSGFGEALFLGEIFVFDEWVVIVCVEFIEEEGLDKANFLGKGFESYRGVWFW